MNKKVFLKPKDRMTNEKNITYRNSSRTKRIFQHETDSKNDIVICHVDFTSLQLTRMLHEIVLFDIYISICKETFVTNTKLKIVTQRCLTHRNTSNVRTEIYTFEQTIFSSVDSDQLIQQLGTILKLTTDFYRQKKMNILVYIPHVIIIKSMPNRYWLSIVITNKTWEV